MDSSVKNLSKPLWELISGHLNDGAECLVLKMPTGQRFCEYAPSPVPPGKFWHSYYEQNFVKGRFVSREACIRDAERIAGHALSVREFPSFKSAGGEK